MKTTIDLPDALAEEAKTIAHEHGTTLRELVISGLRTELDRRSSIGPVDFVFPTMKGHGLVADLEAGDVLTRSYGLPE